MKKTSARSVPTAYQTSIFGLPVFPVRTPPCRESVQEYTAHELDCFLSLFGSCGKEVRINPDGLSLKMLRDCFQWAEQGILPKFSVSWPHWGMVSNMRFSIPEHLECLNIEKESILSEILQPEVPEKYYLSEQQTQKLLNRLLEAHREAVCTEQEAFQQLSLLEAEESEVEPDCIL